MNSSLSTSQTERGFDAIHVVLLFGAALFRFINLGFLDLQAWDEALYTVRAQAALQPGMWLDQTPLAIDGLYSALHPPLHVWGTAVVFQIIGVSECSARLISAISAGLTVFVIYSIGKSLSSKEAGLYATLLYSLNPFAVFFSRQGQFDSLLVLLLSLSVLAAIKSMQRDDRKYIVYSGIFVGLALMTKLFVGCGIPVAYGLWIMVARPAHAREHWKRLFLLSFIAAVVAGPWHIYMTVQHGNGDPLFLIHSSAVVQRSLFGIEGNVKSLEFFYYFNQLVVLFPLGLAFFVHQAWESYREKRDIPLFLLLWFVFFFLVFSLIRTKLAVYLLPMFVPAALLAGMSLDKIAKREVDRGTCQWIILLTFIFAIWSSSQFVRNSVKGVLASFLSLQGPPQHEIVASSIFLGVLLVGCGGLWLLFRSDRFTSLGLLPHFLLLTSFGLSSSAVVIFDRQQYVDGASSLTAFIRHSQVRQIVVAGYERNPQLTYYLKGADIGWNDEIDVRRIIPPTDTALYRPWIRREMAGEGDGTLLLIEKDKFIRYRMIDPDLFLSDGYVRVFESRRYAAFLAGRAEFLASSHSGHREQSRGISFLSIFP